MAEPTTPGAASGDDVDQLLKLPIFQSLSGSFLKLNRDAIWRRPFRAGDVVCREGEFGSTAFYILDGTVDVFLSSPIKHVQQQTAAAGWFTKVRSLLADRVQHAQALAVQAGAERQVAYVAGQALRPQVAPCRGPFRAARVRCIAASHGRPPHRRARASPVSHMGVARSVCHAVEGRAGAPVPSGQDRRAFEAVASGKRNRTPPWPEGRGA